MPNSITKALILFNAISPGAAAIFGQSNAILSGCLQFSYLVAMTHGMFNYNNGKNDDNNDQSDNTNNQGMNQYTNFFDNTINLYNGVNNQIMDTNINFPQFAPINLPGNNDRFAPDNVNVNNQEMNPYINNDQYGPIHPQWTHLGTETSMRNMVENSSNNTDSNVNDDGDAIINLVQRKQIRHGTTEEDSSCNILSLCPSPSKLFFIFPRPQSEDGKGCFQMMYRFKPTKRNIRKYNAFVVCYESCFIAMLYYVYSWNNSSCGFQIQEDMASKNITSINVENFLSIPCYWKAIVSFMISWLAVIPTCPTLWCCFIVCLGYMLGH